MSRPKILPDDIKGACLNIVKGYNRRVANYHMARREIIDGTVCRYQTVKDERTGKYIRVFAPRSTLASRTTESKMQQLAEIEGWPETKRMRAVEHAKLQVGLDLPEDDRQKLISAIILNCESGREYRYEYLDVPDSVGRTNFYDRRTTFLADIAKFLELI